MRRSAIFALFAAALQASDIAADKYLAHIKFLASPELKGRRTGTPELEKAAAYIARQFHAVGLKPVGGSAKGADGRRQTGEKRTVSLDGALDAAPVLRDSLKGYMQEFEITARTGLGKGNKLSLVIGQRVTELWEQRDFVPLSLSTNGETMGPLVFAGYGISAPEFHYDDYEKIDARAKVVILLRHEPQEDDEKSVFGGKNYTVHSELASKVANAKLHGAAAVLLCATCQTIRETITGSTNSRPLWEPRIMVCWWRKSQSNSPVNC